MIDSGWIKALELPTKTFAGIGLTCFALIFADWMTWIPLADLYPKLKMILIVAAIVATCLFFVGLVSAIVESFMKKSKASLLSVRREARRKEQEELQNKKKAAAIGRLDHLSDEEIAIIAMALKAGTQSIAIPLNSPWAGHLVASGLLFIVPGAYDRYGFPFKFFDFAWKEILARKEYFLQRDKEREIRHKKQGR